MPTPTNRARTLGHQLQRVVTVTHSRFAGFVPQSQILDVYRMLDVVDRLEPSVLERVHG